MPKIRSNSIYHYYEQQGDAPPMVFVHGAFADARIWEPQWKYFSSQFRLLRYDLRGHGRTGATDLNQYSIATFVDDLTSLLDVLDICSPILCGLSMGGVIAQTFAVRNPERTMALVLASSAVSASLSLSEKLLRYVLFPHWVMSATTKLIGVPRFIQFSLWLARALWGNRWLGRDEATIKYVEQCMLSMDSQEYLKTWEAFYGFDLLPLERIRCPVLVLNGEYESRGTFRHTQEILGHIPQAKAEIIPYASHAMNMENPEIFNKIVEEFLHKTLSTY